MSHLKDEIKDEEKGESRYRMLAKKEPANRKKFLKMARDEESHHEELEKMERREHSKCKSKALDKKLKKK